MLSNARCVATSYATGTFNFCLRMTPRQGVVDIDIAGTAA
jgi:hypothetical protein